MPRSFAFISMIPPSATEQEVLRALRDYCAGVMKVIVLPSERGNGGYALALFQSESHSIEAANTEVVVKGEIVRLRVVRKGTARALEGYYVSTIEIDGEVVSKADLAPTRGLHQALRCLSRPMWCTHTKQSQDCPNGSACIFVHKQAFQTTLKRCRADTLEEPTELIPANWHELLPAETKLRRTDIVLTSEELEWIRTSYPHSPPLSSLKCKIESCLTAIGCLCTVYVGSLHLNDAPLRNEVTLADLSARFRPKAQSAQTMAAMNNILLELLISIDMESRVSSSEQVIEVLRSSMALLVERLSGSNEMVITLQEWVSVHPSQDLLVFVDNGAVTAVTQCNPLVCAPAGSLPSPTAVISAADSFVERLAYIDALPAKYCCRCNFVDGVMRIVALLPFTATALRSSLYTVAASAPTAIKRVKFADRFVKMQDIPELLKKPLF
jgi:hypothetical protein